MEKPDYRCRKEQISPSIIHITYENLTAKEGLRDITPVAFSYGGKEVLRQTLASFTPKVLYRYETDPSAMKKKMTANGEVTYAEALKKVPDKEAYEIEVRFQIGEKEILTGLGQYEDGILDYRNHTEYLYESNMRIAIPFLITTGHYGILLDSESSMVFTSKDREISFRIDAGSRLSYYVLLGEGIQDLIRAYHELTGKPSMLPRWCYGYIQSKERYESGEELVEIAEHFRKEDIPLDCVVQDWYSWEEGLWGEKKFDKKRYPDIKDVVKRLHKHHSRFMVSIWPNMSPASENYREFAAAGELLPNSNVYNAYEEKARDRYWQQVKAEIMSSGTDALWCDNAEPFSDADWSGPEKKPEEKRYEVVRDFSQKSMDQERLNGYGLAHAKGIYENWRRDYPEKRVVNLTRSGYTGIQQYGAILWSGDITATYDTLRKQIVEGMKMSMTGMPYWTLDIGGFFVVDDAYENRGCNDTDHKPLWFWHGDYNAGVGDLGYRELYVRWLEFGTFLPIMRSHGTDTPREPWRFGLPGEPFYDAIVSHIKLRYRLLPYLYSLGAAAHRDSAMMMRALLVDFPEDERASTIADEYMLGPSLLIAPVYTAMYYGKNSEKLEGAKKTREVYLPKGCGWYDFYTDRYYEGGQSIEADAPLDRIPVYVKAGSILPMSSDIRYADEKDGMPEVLRVYEGRDASFHLYLDAGDGYRYEEGEYALVELTYTEATHEVTQKVTGDYPVERKFRVEKVQGTQYNVLKGDKT